MASRSLVKAGNYTSKKKIVRNQNKDLKNAVSSYLKSVLGATINTLDK